jgi:dihydropteroate synthase
VRCEQAGIAKEKLLLDPGFGFGKATDLPSTYATYRPAAADQSDETLPAWPATDNCGCFFNEHIVRCEQAGIAKEKLLLDPGFGFGKNLTHNYQLLARLGEFHHFGLPLLVGMSRKSMVGPGRAAIFLLRSPPVRSARCVH